jgi:hypothetical protein
MASSSPPTGSVEAIVQRTTISLPTLWKIVWSVTSVLAAMILALLGMLYNGAKSEWIALRSDVRALQQQVAAQPTGEQFRELTHRVELIERQVNGWDE